MGRNGRLTNRIFERNLYVLDMIGGAKPLNEQIPRGRLEEEVRCRTDT
jgi:hypothetical protein